MRINPTLPSGLLEICREAFERPQLGPKSGHIDLSDEGNRRDMLLTYRKMHPTRLLYRKFSPFARFQQSESGRVHSRHPNRQPK